MILAVCGMIEMHMGKKNDKKTSATTRGLNEKTRDWIVAVIFFLGSFVFLLAGFGKAGVLGRSLYSMISFLFGISYFLFPAIFLWLGSLFIRHKKPFVVLTSIAGEALLFFSILGLLGAAGKNGGVIGSAIASSLVTILDFYATIVLLVALLAISLLVSFDTTPSFGWLMWPFKLFSRNKKMPEYERSEEHTSELFDEETEENKEEDSDEPDDISESEEDEAKEKSGGLAGMFAF